MLHDEEKQKNFVTLKILYVLLYPSGTKCKQCNVIGHSGVLKCSSDYSLKIGIV